VSIVPQRRAEKSFEAERRYHKGEKLVDIAKSLDVPEGTVRRWKCDQDWEGRKSGSSKKKQTERSDSKTNKKNPNARKKRGAPLGNKNALGNEGGAPLRNKNAEKHGIYSMAYADLLEEKEQQIWENMVVDEEQILIDQIALFTIRERRLIEKLNQFRQQDENSRGLMLTEIDRFETKRDFESDEDKQLYNERQRDKIEEDKLLPGHQYKLTTVTRDNSELMLRAHNELTRVQEQKRRCTEALHRLRQSKQEAKANSLADDWIIALTGGDVDE
jgi:uncharacterized protein YjcR